MAELIGAGPHSAAPARPPSRITGGEADQMRRAAADLLEGARRWPLWGTLAWNDIRQRYRRSIVGPFWLTISMGLMVAGLGVLYAGLFKQDIERYLPHLALGLIAWGLISTMLIEGCTAFIGGESFIKQLPAPLSVHVYRIVWRNVIVFAHNFAIYFLVAATFRIWPGWYALQVLPGMALLLGSSVWAVLLLGVVSARFRDIPPIVNSVMQFLFFLTPIFWSADLLPERAILVEANPFYHMVEAIRAPLLGQSVRPDTWWTLVFVTVLGWVLTFWLFSRYRRRVAYWV